MQQPDISKASVRAKLTPRTDPYWKRIAKGCYLGFYRGKNGGTWHARFRDHEGKQHHRPLTSASDYDIADKQAREWFAACGRGMVLPGTVQEACAPYVERIKSEKGEEQARRAEGYLRRRVYGTPFAQIKLDELRTHHVQTWRDGLLAVETKSAANRDLKQLKAALNHAFGAELVASDQAWRKVKGFPGAGTARAQYLTIPQRRKLLKFAKATSPALGLLVEAALHTAARPIELQRAHVSDLDVVHGTLTLQGYKGKDGSSRRRSVPLTPVALAFFKRVAGGRPSDAPLLTSDAGGRWWKHDELFRAARDAAGLGEDVTLYVVRHSVIASWLADGIDTQTVSKIAGTGIAMLESHYSKFIRHHAADRLAAVKVF